MPIEEKKTTNPASGQKSQNTGKNSEKGTNKTIIMLGVFMIAIALVLIPVMVISGNRKKAEEARVNGLKQQAAQFDATVVSIGAVTLEDENTIVVARKTYDGFDDETKGYTTKYNMLVSAEDQLGKLLSARKQDTEKTEKAVAEIKDDVKKVTDQLNEINNAKANNTTPTTTYDKALLANARNTYNSLTIEEKSQVPAETVKALEDAENEIARQEKEAQAEAQRKAEEEAQKKEQERLALEEKQRAEAERQAEEARQAQQRQETQQSTGGNTGNTGNTGSGSGSGYTLTQEELEHANRQAEETFGEGSHLPTPEEWAAFLAS